MSTEIQKIPTLAELTKVCAWCKITLPLSEFYPRRERGLNEYRSHCKNCAKEKQKNNRDKANQYNRNSYQKNKEKRKTEAKVYRVNNLEKVKETERRSRRKHREKRLEYSIRYHRERRKNDELFLFRHQISTSIYNSFKRGEHSKTKSCEVILGCDIPFFRDYIKSKFKRGMTFSNYGKWHLDHIIPVSEAKTKDDLEKLNHYTNFQPLWASDNLQKSNKTITKQLSIF